MFNAMCFWAALLTPLGFKPTPIEDPWTIVDEFRNAAKLAKRAGFDGVERTSKTYPMIQILTCETQYNLATGL